MQLRAVAEAEEDLEVREERREDEGCGAHGESVYRSMYLDLAILADSVLFLDEPSRGAPLHRTTFNLHMLQKLHASRNVTHTLRLGSNARLQSSLPPRFLKTQEASIFVSSTR